MNTLASAGHEGLTLTVAPPPFRLPAGPASAMSLDLSLRTAAPEACSPAEDLLLRLRNGEPSAVAEAYDLHHAVVRRFAQRLLGDDGHAEDMVQEVFLALPRAIGSFRGESTLRTFLVSVAVHQCRHHVRASMRRRAHVAAAEVEGALNLSVPPPDPEQQAARKQLASVLTQALDALPLDQRVAFVLCEVEQRTSREAAHIANTREATMRTRLHFAKKKLRTWLEQRGHL
jgi:RNA polymerase sigma-70 factor (ECF subfamily)